MQKVDSNSSAGTVADSDKKMSIYSSASIAASRMLVAVLSAVLSACEWVMEESYIGWYWEEWMDFLIPILKSKKHFNCIGLFILYPIFVIIGFFFSFLVFAVFSVVTIILGSVGYLFMGIILLLGLLFMKRSVSKNSH